MGLDITISRNRGDKKIAYFRKVNFLVKFMEDYYDHIIENCEPIQIDEDCILELKWRCESVLKNRKLADSLLPTVSGFFYGSTEYDDFYYSNVEQVLDSCKKILEEFSKLPEGDSITFDIWY